MNITYCKLLLKLQKTTSELYLSYGSLKQSVVMLSHHLSCYAATACRLSKYGDHVWISAEWPDVVLDPFYGQLLIPQTIVSCAWYSKYRSIFWNGRLNSYTGARIICMDCGTSSDIIYRYQSTQYPRNNLHASCCKMSSLFSKLWALSHMQTKYNMEFNWTLPSFSTYCYSLYGWS